MGIEIERKFLVKDANWRAGEPGVLCRQGYLRSSKKCVIRVRTQGNQGYLTIKGNQQGISRPEFEYNIPLADAEEMLEKLCARPLIEKYRFRRQYAGMDWEIDEFLGENQGLVVAEIELDAEEQVFIAPDWLGREVSDNPRYLNVNLALNPYSKWQKAGSTSS